MKQRILRIITSALLIMTLTMANFLVMGVNVISYASEVINLEKNTNHKNVEFMAYFKDAEGNKLDTLDAYTNVEDLKVYFQVSVNKEGYFNGNILLNNSNFKFKTDVENANISRIEDNRIYLNQINAGDSKEIEVGIQLVNDEKFDLNYINMENSIYLQGIYRDSTEKDISIEAERNIDLNLISPYINAEESIILSQEVITNKVMNYNGEDKRIVQIEVKSGLNNNLFPIEKSIINIQAPKIADKYPENVLVNSNDILATNGQMLLQDDWSYSSETGLISINISNEQKDNKISWIKNGQDKFIITYVLDKDIEINNEKLIINAKIEPYDANNTIINASNEITLSQEEKDSIVTSIINQNETSMYKGKLHAGISRDITYKDIININLNNVASEINVIESTQTINGENIDSVYKTTKISKSDIANILGETGSLNIINAQTGKVIAEITKNTETNENGDIVISYAENVQAITIKVVGTVNIGKIEVENTKTINMINKNLVKVANSIDFEASVTYVSNNNENKLNSAKSNIELKETETSANLEISRTELSAMVMNDNIEFRITLNSKNENEDLFKNPIIKLELPETIETIEVNSINLLYEDEMTIKSAVLKENTIEIVLEGQQTQYKEEAIDGAIIIINANLGTNTITPNSVEEIKLTYTNDNAINYKDNGVVIRNIDIVSSAGVVTTNQVEDYGIAVVNNEGQSSAELALSEETKNITIEKKIINNEENKISDVKILGIFPTKNATDSNNIDIEVGEISIAGIDMTRAKIYYSDNENATIDLENQENNWSETMVDNKNVKKYLIEIQELGLLEEVDLSYQITIPADLDYNKVAEDGYTVYYKNVNTDESIECNYITLETPKGVMLETTLKALSGGKEVTEIKEYETLRYEVVISNTGSEDLSNIKVLAKIPEGTTYINTDELNDEVMLSDLVIEDENKKEIEFNIDKLNKGDQIIKYYEVRVNDGMVDKEISNTVTTQYNEVSEESNKTVTKVKEGALELTAISTDAMDETVISRYQYRYVVLVTNKSNEDMKNVNIKIETNDTLSVTQIYYTNQEGEEVRVNNIDNIKIDKIGAGESINVGLKVGVESFKEVTVKETQLSAVANVDGTQYYSNQVNNFAKSDILLSMETTSENSGGYVKAGDIIKYNVVINYDGNELNKEEKEELIELKNWISNDVTFKKVSRNGIELTEEDYSLKIDTEKNKKILKIEEHLVDYKGTIEYEIEVVVNLIHGNAKVIEIINETALNHNHYEILNSKIQHILTPEDIDIDTEGGNTGVGGTGDNGNGTGNGDNELNPGKDDKYQIISGTAWIDENEDGKKDSTEKTVEGMVVKLLDATTNKFVKDSNGDILTVKTTSTGFYNFNKVEKGKYLVIFEYDTTQYGLTAFEKEGLTNDVDSNVITKDIDVEGTVRKVATTEVIEVVDNNISNIDIGLIVAKKYDLQLDKYISRITVQNNKTVTEDYNGMTLVKKEIDAKQVNSTIVVVEYTIKVTNKGDVTGYAKKIVDYLSSDYKFNSELNKDWYQSENNLYCTSLANEKIEPGESREVKLTVIKEIKEDNIGLVNNTAEIVNSYNELGLTDINSTEGNKAIGENDMGSADLIISIRTGQVVMTVALIILTIALLVVAVFILRRITINRKFI